MNATSPDPSSNSAAESGRPTGSLTRPTERDYDLYRRHSVEFVSQAELAKEHGISQQRVSQVLRNVERWVASHPEDEEAQQVRHSAGDRWEAVIALSMRAFRKSQHDQEVTKQRTLVRGGTAGGNRARCHEYHRKDRAPAVRRRSLSARCHAGHGKTSPAVSQRRHHSSRARRARAADGSRQARR